MDWFQQRSNQNRNQRVLLLNSWQTLGGFMYNVVRVKWININVISKLLCDHQEKRWWVGERYQEGSITEAKLHIGQSELQLKTFLLLSVLASLIRGSLIFIQRQPDNCWQDGECHIKFNFSQILHTLLDLPFNLARALNSMVSFYKWHKSSETLAWKRGREEGWLDGLGSLVVAVGSQDWNIFCQWGDIWTEWP